MKILVNTITTKKYSGGAYQIANNFVRKTLEHSEISWEYVVSKDLDEILPDEMNDKENYHVFPTQPDYKGSYKRVKHELKELEEKLRPDVVYSITAPSYFSFQAPEVMRFTNPWVTHPNKYSWSVLSMKEKIRTLLYCWNQRRLMRKTPYFITQSEMTREGIIRITGTAPENVVVVKNVLPQIFKSLPQTTKFQEGHWVDIACVGAPVPHKDFDILPDVLKELKVLCIDNVRFRVTIPVSNPLLKTFDDKLKKYGLEGRIITHGRCTQTELAEMYQQCQLCFLPTLLEVFSASSLEAMFFQLPTVITDFCFNREVMADSALYYEPMNARAAALQIKRYMDETSLSEEMKGKMKRRLTLFEDYDRHFNDIVDFLCKVGRGKN